MIHPPHPIQSLLPGSWNGEQTEKYLPKADVLKVHRLGQIVFGVRLSSFRSSLYTSHWSRTRKSWSLKWSQQMEQSPVRISQPCSQHPDPTWTPGSPGRVLEMLILHLPLDVLNQNPHFNKIPATGLHTEIWEVQLYSDRFNFSPLLD